MSPRGGVLDPSLGFLPGIWNGLRPVWRSKDSAAKRKGKKEPLVGIPLKQIIEVGSYIVKKELSGAKRYPLVLMMEPLFRCNLACAGCGKIDYPDEILNKRISYEDAMEAVDECGAPVVVIAGGEPLIHKDLPKIVRGIMAKKKYAIVCTNAILLEKKMDEYEPSPYFTWSIHLDGDK